MPPGSGNANSPIKSIDRKKNSVNNLGRVLNEFFPNLGGIHE
jgi:hypothetical protein